MGIFVRNIMDIPLESLEQFEERFFAQIKMDREEVLKTFAKVYEKTRTDAYEKLKVKAIIASCSVEKIDGIEIFLEDGQAIRSEILSQLFFGAGELVMVVVTAQGYDELEALKEGMLEELFYDAWGTAAASRGHAWVVKMVKDELARRGLYATQGWSPGQHNVDIRLQDEIFERLHPEEIGVTLSEGYMMMPQKSASSFIGISKDKSVTQVQACDFCSLRENCPSAYS